MSQSIANMFLAEFALHVYRVIPTDWFSKRINENSPCHAFLVLVTSPANKVAKKKTSQPTKFIDMQKLELNKNTPLSVIRFEWRLISVFFSHSLHNFSFEATDDNTLKHAVM